MTAIHYLFIMLTVTYWPAAVCWLWRPVGPVTFQYRIACLLTCCIDITFYMTGDVSLMTCWLTLPLFTRYAATLFPFLLLTILAYQPVTVLFYFVFIPVLTIRADTILHYRHDDDCDRTGDYCSSWWCPPALLLVTYCYPFWNDSDRHWCLFYHDDDIWVYFLLVYSLFEQVLCLSLNMWVNISACAVVLVPVPGRWWWWWETSVCS